MKTKNKLMLTAILACIAIMCIGALLLSTNYYAYAYQTSESAEVFSEQRLANSARSIEIAETVMQEFRFEVADRGDETQIVYDDNFAGIFIDDEGLLNIAVVDGARSSIANQFDGQVIVQHFIYSHNHLLQIKDVVLPFMYTHGISAIAIGEIENRVLVYIADYIYKRYIIDALVKNNLYSETSIEFIVDPNNIFTLNSRAIYGGNIINEILVENGVKAQSEYKQFVISLGR